MYGLVMTLMMISVDVHFKNVEIAFFLFDIIIRAIKFKLHTLVLRHVGLNGK